MRPVTLIALFGFALIATGAWPAQAQSSIRRCAAPDGSVIFTDRACADVGGSERVPQVGAAGSLGGKAYARGCQRSLRNLIFEVTAAIDSRDANRLAAVYHWTGMSGSGGYRVLAHLDAIVQRPLVQITPVLPSPRVQLDADAGLTVSGNLDPSRVDVARDATEQTDTDTPVDPDDYPQPTLRRTPVGLRVDQTLGNGITAARTVFGLRRNMGCWFIQL